MNAMIRKYESICLAIALVVIFFVMMVFVCVLLDKVIDAVVASEQYEIIRSWGWLPAGW